MLICNDALERVGSYRMVVTRKLVPRTNLVRLMATKNNESIGALSDEEEEELVAPGPRELFTNTIEKPVGPPGTLAEAAKKDYEEWISRQLRLNRIQECSFLAKEDLVEKMRRIDYDEDLAEELQRLVLTGNGVTDKSTSSLLSGHWDEVYPNSGAIRKCSFEPIVSSSGDISFLRFERERELFGPLLSIIRRYDGKKADDRTLILHTPRFGGIRIKLFGLITIPILLFSKRNNNKKSSLFTSEKANSLSGGTTSLVEALDFKYVDSDLVILDIPFPNRHLVVLAPPRENSLFFSLLFTARRFQAFRQRRKIRKQALNNIQNDQISDSLPAPPIGDLVWKVDTAMDVDDDAIQKFLDKPNPYRSRVSIQDMLDGKLKIYDFDVDARLAKIYGTAGSSVVSSADSSAFGLQRIDKNDQLDFYSAQSKMKKKSNNPIGLNNNRRTPPP